MYIGFPNPCFLILLIAAFLCALGRLANNLIFIFFCVPKTQKWLNKVFVKKIAIHQPIAHLFFHIFSGIFFPFLFALMNGIRGRAKERKQYTCSFDNHVVRDSEYTPTREVIVDDDSYIDLFSLTILTVRTSIYGLGKCPE